MQRGNGVVTEVQLVEPHKGVQQLTREGGELVAIQPPVDSVQSEVKDKRAFRLVHPCAVGMLAVWLTV